MGSKIFNVCGNKMVVVFLNITTFVGTSAIGATHYYGTLSCGDEKVDLECILTAHQAAKLNKESWAGPRTYKRGDKSRGFDDREKLVAAALNEYKKRFVDASILILGNSANCDPQPVLDGPQSTMDALNALYDKAESIGGWSNKDRTKMQKISDKWDAIFIPLYD